MEAMFIGGPLHGKSITVNPEAKDLTVEAEGKRFLYFRHMWVARSTATPFFALNSIPADELDVMARPLLPSR